MMKYNLMVSYISKGQKGLTVAKYLEKTYPDIISYSTEIKENCDRNIILSQLMTFVDIRKFMLYTNSIHFIRPEENNVCINRATNGFSVYKENAGYYKYCIPMMYDYNNYKPPLDIGIGYYDTPYRNTRYLFLEYLKNNVKKIKNISLLGDRTLELKFKCLNINKDLNVMSFIDKDKFFSSITHLVTPMSRTFIDPWPTVLEEGVRANKQIIIIKTYRNWKDGIDDICDCIEYHDSLDFNTKRWYNNIHCCIKSFNLDEFYKKLFANNFEYCFDIDKYDKFSEWCEDYC